MHKEYWILQKKCIVFKKEAEAYRIKNKELFKKIEKEYEKNSKLYEDYNNVRIDEKEGILQNIKRL